MYTHVDVPGSFYSLNEKCRELTASVCERIKPVQESITLESNSTVFDGSNGGKLYLLKSGVLSCFREDQVLFFFDDGDLVGLDYHFSIAGTRMTTDFAVVADEYSIEDFHQAISGDPELKDRWVEFLSAHLKLITVLAGTMIHNEVKVSPEVRRFEAGETIVEQGSKASEVFTLVEGHADVFVDGVKVGEILDDEIFGVMATLTETSRIAEVKASEISLVTVLPGEKFSELVRSRPRLVVKMVEDMARKMVDLNTKVVGLSEGKQISDIEKE